LSGTWGDVGLYSFDKGKNVSAIDGGVIVTSSREVAHAVERRVAALPRSSAADGAHAMLKLAAYATLLRPSLYWIPNGILGLGTTLYATDFPLRAMSRSLAALAATMVPRSGAFLAARAERADCLRSRLQGRSGLAFVRRPSDAEPAHLRLPVLADDGLTKGRLIEALNRVGIGASGSYPSSIADIPALRGRVTGAADCVGGRETAERILTLPTHPLVGPGDIERAVATIERVLDAAGAGLCAAVARTEAR